MIQVLRALLFGAMGFYILARVMTEILVVML